MFAQLHQVPTPDLSVEMLSALSAIMLAQGQESIWNKTEQGDLQTCNHLNVYFHLLQVNCKEKYKLKALSDFKEIEIQCTVFSSITSNNQRLGSAFNDLDPRLSLLFQVGVDVIRPCKICEGCQIHIPRSFDLFVDRPTQSRLQSVLVVRSYYIKCQNGKLFLPTPPSPTCHCEGKVVCLCYLALIVYTCLLACR